MPLYEYQCDSCGERFERIQKFSDPPISECPKCGGAVRKLLSSPAIQFKGSGFYITDYPKSGPGKPGSPAGDSGDKATSDKASAETKATSSDSPKTEASAKADASTKSDSSPKTETKTPSKPKSAD